jgi:D-ribulokinase
MAHLIGVDVGTGSARAGVFDAAGHLLGTAKRDIAIWHDAGGVVEQSSADIWAAVCAAVRAAVAEAGIDPGTVAGIGFDATCSLVVLGPGGAPLADGPSGDPARDIMVWMDHRATDQAARINAGRHDVLAYVGGRISPEMETPKLLWLAENLPATFAGAWQFMDLADFLTWRATGSLARSACTVTCKWTWLAHEGRWDPAYFRAIGLGALVDEGFARIGTEVVAPGTPLAGGLTAQAAGDLGLLPGTAVGAGLIDAHAGGIATAGITGDAAGTMAYVFGTSSCTMTTTAQPVFVPGVWGPYFGAMVQGMWLNEGGQSAAGAAIARLLDMHPLSPSETAAARAQGLSLPQHLARLAGAGGLSEAVMLADGLHVVPEFLGNRAPFADPGARAIIAGLGMEQDRDSLVALYVAALCGIGYGLRQIIETQARHGAPVRRIAISGGAGQEDLVRQLLADTTGLAVVAPDSAEPVLLGAAMLGAMAGKVHGDMQSAMAAMARHGQVFTAADGEIAATHTDRYRAFERLQDVARQCRTVSG